MTDREGQKRVAEKFIKHMVDRIQDNIEDIPEDWDGIEIGWWMVNLMKEKAVRDDCLPMGKTRREKFNLTCFERNL